MKWLQGGTWSDNFDFSFRLIGLYAHPSDQIFMLWTAEWLGEERLPELQTYSTLFNTFSDKTRSYLSMIYPCVIFGVVLIRSIMVVDEIIIFIQLVCRRLRQMLCQMVILSEVIIEDLASARKKFQMHNVWNLIWGWIPWYNPILSKNPFPEITLTYIISRFLPQNLRDVRTLI